MQTVKTKNLLILRKTASLKQYKIAVQLRFNELKSAALVHELVRVTKLYKEAMEEMSEDAEFSI